MQERDKILHSIFTIIATNEDVAQMIVQLGLIGNLGEAINQQRRFLGLDMIAFELPEEDDTPCPECGDHHEGQELMSGFLELLGELESLKDVLEKKAKAEKRKSQ